MRKLLCALFLFAAGGVAEAADTFLAGDVFASVHSSTGTYQQWRKVGATWTLIDTLVDTTSGGYTFGGAFDASGDFYGTDSAAAALSKYEGPGTPHTRSNFGSASVATSIVFSSSGTMYVGSFFGTNGIRRIDAASGAVLQTYGAGSVLYGMALAADQSTMYYTDFGAVRRWNVATNTQMTDLVTGLGADGVRVLGDGSVLVSAFTNIRRYSAAGALLQTYDVAGRDLWFGLDLNNDGTSFWGGDAGGTLYRFDILTGAVLDTFTTPGTGNRLYGVTVFGAGQFASVSAVPLPPAAWMGLALLVGLGVMRRRRRLAPASA